MSRDSEGLPLHVEERGEGEPLVFLHGFGASSFTWRHWVGPLSRRYRVVVVDLKGFGAAPAPRDDRYGPRDQAELVYRLVVERDLRDLTLVGHSWGGGIALITALRLLDEGEGRLKRLVSVSGLAYRQKVPPAISLARHQFAGSVGFRLVPVRWLMRRILDYVIHDPSVVDETIVRGYADPLGDDGTRYAVLQSAAQVIPEDLDEIITRYGELDVPALLLWGREDAVVPLSVGERLAGDLPDARLVVFDRCGHLIPIERPRESLQVLAGFLEETS